MESAVRQRVAKLESLAATLEVDQDVALSDLPRCLAQVEEDRGLQDRQSDLRCELDRIIDRRSPIDAAILAAVCRNCPQCRAVPRYLRGLTTGDPA